MAEAGGPWGKRGGGESGGGGSGGDGGGGPRNPWNLPPGGGGGGGKPRGPRGPSALEELLRRMRDQFGGGVGDGGLPWPLIRIGGAIVDPAFRNGRVRAACPPGIKRTV
jgi:hypothetical protein